MEKRLASSKISTLLSLYFSIRKSLPRTGIAVRQFRLDCRVLKLEAKVTYKKRELVFAQLMGNNTRNPKGDRGTCAANTKFIVMLHNSTTMAFVPCSKTILYLKNSFGIREKSAAL